MGTVTPTALFPSFEALAANNRIIDGLMMELGNEPYEYLAGKIVGAVRFPDGERGNEMGIDGRALHGLIARRALWGSYGTGKKTTVAYGERAVPVEGQDVNPLEYNGQKYFASYKIPVETMAEIEEWGVDAMYDLLRIPREQVLIDRELAWANLFATTSNWGTTLVAGKSISGSGTAHPWDTAASTPVQDIQAVRAAVNKYGIADTMILGVDAANALVANTAFNGTRPMDVDRAILTDDQLVEIIKARFGFANVYIGRAHAETSRVPTTSAPSAIWGSTVWIGKLDLGESRGTSTGRVAAKKSALVNVVAQDLFADVIGPRINGEHDDTYVARVRMIESLAIPYSQLGGTITGILTT